MAYKALYREWRPQTFADVVGQRHVVTTLANALRHGRLAHAYLFSGPRGTGKTTMAKLLAKAVNCERPIDGYEPCNECATCIGITAGAVVDVVEMDAASNRGVDEIRSLLEQVQYTPAEVQRKVYIIDEVHMLTTEAFNALLKTLEEPPEYCLFVLATTELHKVPATIASRCQRFDFGRAPAESVVERLRLVAKGIDAKVEEAALWQIARASEGGLRDALSLLDQALAFAQEQVDVEAVSAVLGGVPSERLGQLYAAVFRHDTADLLTRLSAIWEQGADPVLVVTELIAYGRDAILNKNGVKSGGAEHRERYDPTFPLVIRDVAVADVLAIVERLARLQGELRYQSQAQLVVDMVLTVCCDTSVIQSRSAVAHPAPDPPRTEDATVAALKRRVEHLEQALADLRASLRSGAGAMALSEESSRQTVPWEQETERLAPSVASPSVDTQDEMRSQPEQVSRRPTTSTAAAPKAATASRKAPAASTGLANARAVQRLRPMNADERELLQSVVARWAELLEEVKQRSVQTRAWLMAGRPEALCEGGLWVVFKGSLHAETVMKSPHAELVAQVLEARFGVPMRLQALTEEAWSAVQASVLAGEEQAATGEQREPWVEKVVEWFGEDRVTILED